VKKNISIVDYNVGNKHSIFSAISAVSENDNISFVSSKKDIESASHLIFPGVGAIQNCITALKKNDVLDPVLTHIKSGKPILAICIGMQLLFQSSAENGGVKCLGTLDDTVEKLDNKNVKIPHMGWNSVSQKNNHPIWKNIPKDSQFYFVHSYAAKNTSKKYVIGSSTHSEKFVATIVKDNIVATQFHPEKSHFAGLQLIKNFLQQ
jgi:glutamine amidotransferase